MAKTILLFSFKDENFGTQWVAKNDGVDTWVEFVWKSKQKVNRWVRQDFKGSRG